MQSVQNLNQDSARRNSSVDYQRNENLCMQHADSSRFCMPVLTAFTQTRAESLHGSACRSCVVYFDGNGWRKPEIAKACEVGLHDIVYVTGIFIDNFNDNKLTMTVDAIANSRTSDELDFNQPSM